MSDECIARGLALAARLEGDRTDAVARECDLDDAIVLLRELARANAKLAAKAELAEMLLEVKEEQFTTLSELFAKVVHPVLEVKTDVLCAPLVGPIDAETLQHFSDRILVTAHARRIRMVIIDLTAATIADAPSALSIVNVFRALRLLGVRGAVSGINESLAQVLTTLPEDLGVPIYRTLATALSAST